MLNGGGRKQIFKGSVNRPSTETTSGSKMMVKRLTHYTSMPDGNNANGKNTKEEEEEEPLKLNNKENQTPNVRAGRNYR